LYIKSNERLNQLLDKNSFLHFFSLIYNNKVLTIMNANYKQISQLEQMRMIESGKKERYCINQLGSHLSMSYKYNYEFHHTSSTLPICYDALLYVRCKLTGNILNMYLVEVKVRDVDIKYDELIFEKAKLKNLQKERDQFYKKQMSQFKPNILYIQFCSEGTYMYFIDDIIEEGLLPKVTTMEMNKVTVATKQEKVKKLVYLLPKNIAFKSKYKFTIKEYENSLIMNIASDIQEIKKINKIQSLF